MLIRQLVNVFVELYLSIVAQYSGYLVGVMALWHNELLLCLCGCSLVLNFRMLMLIDWDIQWTVLAG